MRKEWKCGSDAGCSLLQQGQGRVWVDSQVLAGGFAVISQVCGPIPLREQVQQLEEDREREINQTPSE